MNNESYISVKMSIWILLLLLASGNGQFTQESVNQEFTSRPPSRNRYDEWDQNTGFGFRNPLGQNENVIIKEA